MRRGFGGARGQGVYRGQGRGVGRGIRGARGAGGRRGRAVPSVILPPGWKETTDAVPPTVKQFTDISGPTEILPTHHLIFSMESLECLCSLTL